jgi:heparanase 1
MGNNVLSTSFLGTKKIRAYAHCAKHSVSTIHIQLSKQVCILFFHLIRFFVMQKGFTVLLINLDNSTTIQAKLAFNSTWSSPHKLRSQNKHVIHLPQYYKGEIARQEYHLTAKDGNLHSQTMLLNGNPLNVNSSGDIPPLEPLYANSSNPIKVDPFSIVFVHIPDVILPACR